jgi:MoaA/NifB/PqqE/SkfB family radical SAM enzyme
MKSKNDVVKLYDQFGPNMCLAPFVNSFYSTCGVAGPGDSAKNHVRPCSMIRPGAHWDIETNSIVEARNNQTWHELRQTFLQGNLHEYCTTCANAEKAGASSPRQLNNEYLFEHLDIDLVAEVEKIIANDLFSKNVYAMDYMPSNFCNYACIMCFAGASSQRYTFEIQKGNKISYNINAVDKDFFEIIKDVKILGFTGGETIMQPEVHKLLDYIIEQDLAKQMIITILTNGSEFPDSLIEKFKCFQRVLYTVSIDGTGEIIEYQRRGAKWPTVEQNALKIHNCEITHEIVNHVTSAVNVLNAMDFVDWCHKHDIKHIAVSAVYQEHLGVAALPPELHNLALARLQQGRKRYEHYAADTYSNYEKNWLRTIDLIINTLQNTKHKPTALEMFKNHIKIEDLVSKKPLKEVVPEWAPWFD